MRIKQRDIPRAICGRALRSFTLTELLVAIGMVALLTVAIGQIFRSIGGIVGSGTALAEVDQLARSIERQLRDDFEAMNRMSSEDTFLVIRMREIGDVNRNGEIDDGETALYLTQDDREADLRDGYEPYERDAQGVQLSRAVTRRLDEMAFLGMSNSLYSSFQFNSDIKPWPNEKDPAPAVSAQHARIYWGHALTPAAITETDTSFEPDDYVVPPRVYHPSGLAASSQTRQVGWGAAFGARNSRNEYASGWILARQPLLLVGGQAAGWRDQPGAAEFVAPIGDGREFAPFIRDRETLQRFNSPLSNLQSMWTNVSIAVTDDEIAQNLWLPTDPEERPIAWGRVDICAQSEVDVRRWLEGEDPGWTSSQLQISSFPFDGGALTTIEAPAGEIVNNWLWRRVADGEPTPPVGVGNVANALDRQRWNLRGVRSAIAGVLTRPLAEAEAPRIDRGPRLDPTQTSSEANRGQRHTDDALMDLHTTIAPRCSNFEIAWTDGSTALRNIDLNNDDVYEYIQGDILWFDISTLPSAPGVVSRSTYSAWARVGDEGLATLRPNQVLLRSYKPNEEDPSQPNPFFPDDFPEINFEAMRDSFTMAPERPLNAQDGWLTLTNIADVTSPRAMYNPDTSGGAPSLNADGTTADDPQEYMAVWPFRIPDSEGRFIGPWPKNIHIRVRMTLHDAQRRLPNGKQYEFIFRVSPGE